MLMPDFTIIRNLQPPFNPSKHTFNLIGRQFGRLTPLGLIALGRTLWLCRCKCGTFTIVGSGHLRTGHTVSCGCYRLEQRRITPTTHGARYTRAFRAWHGLKDRILNPNNRAYKNYGGRGLTVHPSWLKFENFLADMGQPPSRKHSLERVDNNKGYSPDNCVWATPMEQMANTRRNRILTVNGVTMHLAAWCRKLNIKHSGTVCARLRRGHTVEEALGLVPLRDKRFRHHG